MRLLNNQFDNSNSKPMSIQMLIACICSWVVMLFTNCVFILLESKNFADFLSRLNSTPIYVDIFFTTVIFLPMNILIFLTIQIFRIFPYLIYSKTLVIFETLIFMIALYFLNVVVDFRIYLALAVASTLLFIYICRLTLPKLYKKYQAQFVNLYVNSPMNEKTDLIITSSLFFIPLLICFLLVFLS